jgi:cyanophycin synthetase
VPAAAIEMVPDEQEAHQRALSLAGPGDLVLLFADALTRTWKQVINFQPDSAPPLPVDRTRAAPITVPDLAPVEVPSLNGDALVRDERGVRLARETED